MPSLFQDYDPTRDSGNGFVFYDYTAEALWDSIVRTKRHFANRPQWEELMRRAMACDFSWDRAAEKYEVIHRRALGR